MILKQFNLMLAMPFLSYFLHYNILLIILHTSRNFLSYSSNCPTYETRVNNYSAMNSTYDIPISFSLIPYRTPEYSHTSTELIILKQFMLATTCVMLVLTITISVQYLLPDIKFTVLNNVLIMVLRE